MVYWPKTRLLRICSRHVQVYRRALSAQQIQAIYSNQPYLIVSEETRAGEVWEATVTPNDGTTDGATVFSNNLTIVSVPEVVIQSPRNITYLYSSIPLTFSAQDPEDSIDWTGYSLDGQSTATSGNTTLISLTEGAYNVTAFANNTQGIMNQSIQHFSIDKCIEDAVPGDTCIFQPGNYSNTSILTNNLTVSCEIRGACIIQGDGTGIGVLIVADNISFTNFTIREWIKGIAACGQNITITNNTLDENRVGIQSCGSNQITIEGNNITSSHSIGISLIDTTDTTIINNNVSSLTAGIYLKNSSRNLIAENTANLCAYGYALQDSSVNTLRQNEGLLGENYDYILTQYSRFNTLDSNAYCKIKTNPQNTFKNNFKGGICP
jgi:parallel beta-helix repeat protein